MYLQDKDWMRFNVIVYTILVMSSIDDFYQPETNLQTHLPYARILCKRED